MNEKCNKYEALFIFTKKKKLRSHIKNCEDCRKEDELMNRVSELIQEAKPQILKARTERGRLKIACAAFAILLSGTLFGIINFNQDISDTLRYGAPLTIEDYGFPVDSYGLIMVD